MSNEEMSNVNVDPAEQLYDLVSVLEKILETGLPRNRIEAEKVLAEVKAADQELGF